MTKSGKLLVLKLGRETKRLPVRDTAPVVESTENRPFPDNKLKLKVSSASFESQLSFGKRTFVGVTGSWILIRSAISAQEGGNAVADVSVNTT